MSDGIIHDLFKQLDSSLRDSRTQPLFASQAPVWIYGAGNVGKDVFRLLTARGIPVVGFLDRQAGPDAAWQGVPIRQPDHAAIDRLRAHVVIGIFNAYVEIPPIVQMLERLGYLRVTHFLDLHDRFAAELGDRYWLTSRSYYTDLEPVIDAGHGLWADETSRALYCEILKFRFLKDYNALPKPEEGQQYFPTDIPPWSTPLRLVDCGAYDGDTLAQLLGTQLSVEAIAAFEPDPGNFTKLGQFVRARAGAMPDTVCLFPCGVDSATSQARFSSGQGTGSHASSTGDTVIQCVSLDDALPKFKPTLIKMDIEGAEYGALWGARRIIAEHRPALAVCLYHQPGHLWQIPLLVRQLTGGGGRFYLRSHCFNGFELVLYWQP